MVVEGRMVVSGAETAPVFDSMGWSGGCRGTGPVGKGQATSRVMLIVAGGLVSRMMSGTDTAPVLD